MRDLGTMTLKEKLIATLKGTPEERAVLIQDVSPLVATAVLGSPRLTEAEVETFAALPNVNAVVLPAIAGHAGWLSFSDSQEDVARAYRIAAALLRNPQTPPATARRILCWLPADQVQATRFDLAPECPTCGGTGSIRCEPPEPVLHQERRDKDTDPRAIEEYKWACINQFREACPTCKGTGRVTPTPARPTDG